MRETTRDEKWEDERAVSPKNPLAQLLEANMVQITLLMRLYDLQLAVLSSMDENRANEIYDMHEKGGHVNPPLYIPDFNTVPEDPDNSQEPPAGS